MNSKFLIPLLLILAVLSNIAGAQQFGDFTYTSDGSAITITGYNGVNGSVVIPGSIAGLPVGMIGSNSFTNRTNITSVEIPASVTQIGDSSFSGCVSLTDIVIPDSVTSIGNTAFSGCSSLTSVTIGQGVTSMGDMVFANCSNLTGVIFIGNAPQMGSDVFISANSALTIYHKPGATGFSSPTWQGRPISVTDSNFGWTSNGSFITLNSATIPPNGIVEVPEAIGGLPVRTLANHLFYFRVAGEPIIQRLIIPNSVENVGAFTFIGCFLPYIDVLPGNLFFTSEDGVLFSADRTRLIVCPPGKSGNYVIPEGVTVIGQKAFFACRGMQSVVIPNGVTSIESDSFSYCASLTELVIPDGVIAIGDVAFRTCESLSSITLPRSLTSIGLGAFYACKALTHVVIPSGVQTVGSDGFSGCTNLLSVTFNGTAPSAFGARVFDNTNPAFTIKYYTGASGFTSPIWRGYPALALAAQSQLVMWREQYFGSTENTGTAADTYDADGDGHHNLSEYIAGTNPISSVDRFQPVSTTRTGTAFTLTLSGKTGRVYQLQRSLSLAPEQWDPVVTTSETEADGMVELIDLDSPGLGSFYRVQVTKP